MSLQLPFQSITRRLLYNMQPERGTQLHLQRAFQFRRGVTTVPCVFTFGTTTRIYKPTYKQGRHPIQVDPLFCPLCSHRSSIHQASLSSWNLIWSTQPLSSSSGSQLLLHLHTHRLHTRFVNVCGLSKINNLAHKSVTESHPVISLCWDHYLKLLPLLSELLRKKLIIALSATPTIIPTPRKNYLLDSRPRI